MYLRFILKIYSHMNDSLARNNGPSGRNARGTRDGGLYYDFSRALHPRTIETGKTIERQARGSLSLLNNFCVLKFNRAPCSIGDAFVVRVVGRGDTISV